MSQIQTPEFYSESRVAYYFLGIWLLGGFTYGMYEVVSLLPGQELDVKLFASREVDGCEIICIKGGGCQTVGPNSAGKVTNGINPVLGQILFLEEKVRNFGWSALILIASLFFSFTGV